MEKFRGVDYYGIDDLLTEEQRMMRDAVRDWVEAKFLPVVSQHHRDGTFPMELAKDLGEMGVFGATLKGYGCAGLDNVAYGLIMQELERGDSGLRSFASVQSGLVMYPIYSYGSDAQKERWLPRLQSGTALGCFGLTEPDHGERDRGDLHVSRRGRARGPGSPPRSGRSPRAWRRSWSGCCSPSSARGAGSRDLGGTPPVREQLEDLRSRGGELGERVVGGAAPAGWRSAPASATRSPAPKIAWPRTTARTASAISSCSAPLSR